MPNPVFRNATTAQYFEFLGTVDQRVIHPRTGYNGYILDVSPTAAAALVAENFYLLRAIGSVPADVFDGFVPARPLTSTTWNLAFGKKRTLTLTDDVELDVVSTDGNESALLVTGFGHSVTLRKGAFVQTFQTAATGDTIIVCADFAGNMEAWVDNSQGGTVIANDDFVRRNIPSGEIERVNVANDSPGSGQATRQIQFGDISQPITDDSNFSRSGVLVLTQEKTRSGNNPGTLMMHFTGTGSANGFYFWGYGDNGKVFPTLSTRSDYGDANPYSKGFLHRVMLKERTDGGECVGYEIEVRNAGNTDPRRFHVGNAAMQDKRTTLFRVVTQARVAFTVGALGNVRQGGATMQPIVSFTEDLALDVQHSVVVFIGGAGKTLSLPDPVDQFYKGCIFKICNQGTAALALSQPVWLDADVWAESLSFAAPDNKLTVICDGTKWLAI